MLLFVSSSDRYNKFCKLRCFCMWRGGFQLHNVPWEWAPAGTKCGVHKETGIQRTVGNILHEQWRISKYILYHGKTISMYLYDFNWYQFSIKFENAWKKKDSRKWAPEVVASTVLKVFSKSSYNYVVRFLMVIPLNLVVGPPKLISIIS